MPTRTFLRGRGLEPKIALDGMRVRAAYGADAKLDGVVHPMNVDYENLENDVANGLFRESLREELLFGFRQIHNSGERLPLASYYAAQIAEIVNRGAAEPLNKDLAFNLYQEILLAVEAARAEVLGEEISAS